MKLKTITFFIGVNQCIKKDVPNVITSRTKTLTSQFQMMWELPVSSQFGTVNFANGFESGKDLESVIFHSFYISKIFSIPLKMCNLVYFLYF